MLEHQHPPRFKVSRCRPLRETATRRPDRVTLDADPIRYYQLRPIPGQLAWGMEPHQVLIATDNR